jgi:hypothetical protein
MVTRAAWRSYIQYEYEDLTSETVASGAPLQFGDDFVGAGHTAGIPAAGSPVDGYAWVKKIVGAAPPTLALVSNSVGGQIAATLTSASQAQEAGLYFNDSLCFDVTKYGQWEARAALSVLPTGVAGASLGVGSAWVSGGLLSAARYLAFGWAASGALLVTALDGVQSAVSVAATIGGVAVTSDTAMHVFRIDWNNAADIAFYYDGSRVNAAGSVTWTATAGANSVMQPWADIYKASGAGVGTLTVDKIDVFSSR